MINQRVKQLSEFSSVSGRTNKYVVKLGLKALPLYVSGHLSCHPQWLVCVSLSLSHARPGSYLERRGKVGLNISQFGTGFAGK